MPTVKSFDMHANVIVVDSMGSRPSHGGTGAGSAHRPRIDATLLRIIAVLVDIAGITGT